MSSERVRITKRIVDGLLADGTDRFLWDSDVIGFGLRISPAGKLVYVLQYRIEGRQRRFKIGPHGSPWTPETARAEAQSLLGRIVDGIDPQQEKISERKELTLADLSEIYLNETLFTAKESSVRQARNNIENHILPLLGKRRVSKIERSDIEQMLRDIRTQWLDTRAAATMLGFTVGTMQTYRWMGTGPAFRKIGRRVVYSADALAAWQRAQAGGVVSAAA